MHSTALCFFGFKQAPHQAVSFTAELINTTITTSILNVAPSLNAGTIYMTFSIVVVTSNSTTHLEIITL